MATVRAYSVCQSEGGTTQRSRSVYSYSPSVTLQNGDTLDFGGDANSDPENSMRTGLSQAYCHGGVATSGEDSTGAFLAAAAPYANNGGLTPTLIAGNIGGVASTFPAATGAATDVGTLVTGAGNLALANLERVVCSTTNITAGSTGAGLQLVVSTNAAGEPALLATSTDSILAAGNGYANADTDIVALDGFPGATVTVEV